MTGTGNTNPKLYLARMIPTSLPTVNHTAEQGDSARQQVINIVLQVEGLRDVEAVNGGRIVRGNCGLRTGLIALEEK